MKASELDYQGLKPINLSRDGLEPASKATPFSTFCELPRTLVSLQEYENKICLFA